MRVLLTVFVYVICVFLSQHSYARGDLARPIEDDVASVLTPHKALYDIQLVATRSGAQVVNISGEMLYEWRPSCEGWITDHRFNLFYEYADSPAMKITSDFSTFENYKGSSFSFSARRKRDGSLYEELRGRAVLDDTSSGSAAFSMPADLSYNLEGNVMFPMAHTVEMVRQAMANNKFFTATVFDGSDDEGPVEINSFIGKSINPMQVIEPNKDLDMALLNNKAWKIRMAVFPKTSDIASADYEMDIIFHENGVISDMLIDYDNFSVQQKLRALSPVKDRINAKSCGNAAY